MSPKAAGSANYSAAALLPLAVNAQAPGAPRIPGQNPNGMRIFLWTGLKIHSAGQHDYPQFLADWSRLLTDRGAVVSGTTQSLILRRPNPLPSEPLTIPHVTAPLAHMLPSAQQGSS